VSPARSNKLADLPEELAELRKLRVLHCKYNALTCVPAVLARLPLLETLVRPSRSARTRRLTYCSASAVPEQDCEQARHTDPLVLIAKRVRPGELRVVQQVFRPAVWPPTPAASRAPDAQG
jgi:hypothetical protein